MKRCISCNSLIRDDDKLCPYCYMESRYELEEKEYDSNKWLKSCIGIKSPSKVKIGTFDLSEATIEFGKLGISVEDLSEALNIFTINEIREMKGLDPINGGNNEK